MPRRPPVPYAHDAQHARNQQLSLARIGSPEVRAREKELTDLLNEARQLAQLSNESIDALRDRILKIEKLRYNRPGEGANRRPPEGIQNIYSDAIEALERLVDSFPDEELERARLFVSQMSSTNLVAPAPAPAPALSNADMLARRNAVLSNSENEDEESGEDAQVTSADLFGSEEEDEESEPEPEPEPEPAQGDPPPSLNEVAASTDPLVQMELASLLMSQIPETPALSGPP